MTVEQILMKHNVGFDSLVPSMEPPGEISHFYFTVTDPSRREIEFRLDNPILLPEVLEKGSITRAWIEAKVLGLKAVQVEAL